MADKNNFFSKFREAAASVLPIILIVVLVCLLWVPVSPDLMLSFLLGALFLILSRAEQKAEANDL